MEKIVIDLSTIHGGRALLSEIPGYLAKVLEVAGSGRDVVITGAAPVWLYLVAAHALHGKARSLRYDSPVTGEVVIFDHTPF